MAIFGIRLDLNNCVNFSLCFIPIGCISLAWCAFKLDVTSRKEILGYLCRLKFGSAAEQ